MSNKCQSAYRYLPARISISQLEQLFESGEVGSGELLCQNCETSQCLWHLCLMNCANREQQKLVRLDCKICPACRKQFSTSGKLDVLVDALNYSRLFDC